MAALNEILLLFGGSYEGELTAQQYQTFRTEIQRVGYREAVVTIFPPTTDVPQEQEFLAELEYESGMPWIRGRGLEAYDVYADGNITAPTNTIGCPEEGCPEPTDEFYIYLIQ